jgi:hypothetical protein
MSMYVNHAPRLETHSRMHASAYQYMHMDIYTHICMCISMCIFVMRGDSRHIRIYTRACCDRAHLFANMNTYTRLCHICVYICVRTCHTRAYSYMHMDIYTRIRTCLRICMCIFVMRGDSRHIHTCIRSCCAGAHLFPNMHTYSSICQA